MSDQPTTEHEDLREQMTAALTREHYRRAHERIEASPEDHCAAFADATMAVVQPVLDRQAAEIEGLRTQLDHIQCGASIPHVSSHIGPCILPLHHGDVHQDAGRAKWFLTPADPDVQLDMLRQVIRNLNASMEQLKQANERAEVERDDARRRLAEHRAYRQQIGDQPT